MKLIAILRIKDAARVVRESLKRLSELCDEIVIVDNGSRDGTLRIYREFPKVVVVKKTRGFDEGRDRNLALFLARKRNPDWIIWIDSDEVFEKYCTRELLDKYMRRKDINLVMFRMFHFWLDRDRYRVDGKWRFYTARPQRPLFRNVRSAHFLDRKFHGGNIQGVPGRTVVSPVRVKHFGYVYPEIIKRRNRLTAILGKKYPREDKTIRADVSDEVTLEKFREFQNSVVQRIYLNAEKLRWDITQRLEGVFG